MTVQVELALGVAAKQDGLARVEAHSKAFVRQMRRIAEQYASIKGEVTIDDLRIYAEANYIEPHHPNSWGSVFRGADWICVGRRQSGYRSNHAREVKVWRLKC